VSIKTETSLNRDAFEQIEQGVASCDGSKTFFDKEQEPSMQTVPAWANKWQFSWLNFYGIALEYDEKKVRS